MAIPKIIHYCWFGRNPLPELAQKCIASWRKFLPDYEIREWNEDNFDVNIIPYTAEAYRAKKYAFVSDYARFWILYKYGGLYFDTDVEVIKPMDDIIARGPFMGCEKEAENGATTLGVAPGLGLGVNPGLGLIKELLDEYATMHYLDESGHIAENKTIVNHTTDLLVRCGLKDTQEIQQVAGVFIYPKEYFCPKDYITGKMNITDKSVAIHHYGATWKPWEQKLEIRMWQLLGIKKHPLLTWHIDKYLIGIGVKR